MTNDHANLVLHLSQHVQGNSFLIVILSLASNWESNFGHGRLDVLPYAPLLSCQWGLTYSFVTVSNTSELSLTKKKHTSHLTLLLQLVISTLLIFFYYNQSYTGQWSFFFSPSGSIKLTNFIHTPNQMTWIHLYNNMFSISWIQFYLYIFVYILKLKMV